MENVPCAEGICNFLNWFSARTVKALNNQYSHIQQPQTLHVFYGDEDSSNRIIGEAISIIRLQFESWTSQDSYENITISKTQSAC